MGDEREGMRKKKKRKKENRPLHWALVWAKRDGLGLREMGLRDAMGGIGSGCLQFLFRILFNVLAFIFSTNIRSIQGQFLQKIDLNKFPYIYGTFSRSK